MVALGGPMGKAWAGFDETEAAYNRGDYTTALREWRPLAKQGDDVAQFTLGTIYGLGQGVPQDFAESYSRILVTVWVRRRLGVVV